VVILLFAISVILFIGVQYILQLRKKIEILKQEGGISDTHRISATEVIERYFHPGHTWAFTRKGNTVTVGTDDFAQRFIGNVDNISLPEIGLNVKQGEPLFTLHNKNRELTQVAPVSGIIVEVNKKLSSSPAQLNESPMEDAWIAKIATTNLSTEVRNLLKGVSAERWMGSVRQILLHRFSTTPGYLMQDGGTIIKNIGSLIPDDQWCTYVNEFFPYPTSFTTDKKEN
jgi:glycine cleavage system H protein